MNYITSSPHPRFKSMDIKKLAGTLTTVFCLNANAQPNGNLANRAEQLCPESDLPVAVVTNEGSRPRIYTLCVPPQEIRQLEALESHVQQPTNTSCPPTTFRVQVIIQRGRKILNHILGRVYQRDHATDGAICVDNVGMEKFRRTYIRPLVSSTPETIPNPRL